MGHRRGARHARDTTPVTVTAERLQPTAAYRDPTRPVDARVDDLLQRMTLVEKVAQLGGVLFPTLVRGGHLEPAAMTAALQNGIGHVARLSTESGGEPGTTAAFANAIQRMLVE